MTNWKRIVLTLPFNVGILINNMTPAIGGIFKGLRWADQFRQRLKKTIVRQTSDLS